MALLQPGEQQRKGGGAAGGRRGSNKLLLGGTKGTNKGPCGGRKGPPLNQEGRGVRHAAAEGDRMLLGCM